MSDVFGIVAILLGSFFGSMTGQFLYRWRNGRKTMPFKVHSGGVEMEADSMESIGKLYDMAVNLRLLEK